MDRFDSSAKVQHSRHVGSLRKRLAALVAMIALSLSAWVQCAGWQNIPEARMACCAREDECPMHSGDNVSPAHRTITQGEADRCCALSGRIPATPSSSSQIAPVVLAVVSTPASVLLPDLAPVSNRWEADVSIAVTPVSRHILLSVFLV